METEPLKPIDKAFPGKVNESPGRNKSERVVASKVKKIRGPSPHPEGEGSMSSRTLTDTTDHLGGVEATAR